MSGDGVDYRPSGRVDFANLMAVREEGEAAIEAAGEQVVFDLSGIENGNGAAAALLLAWFRAAERLEKKIVFRGVPGVLGNIIELSGLTNVLPLDNAVSEGVEPGPLEPERLGS